MGHKMKKEHVGYDFDKARGNNYYLISTSRGCPCWWGVSVGLSHSQFRCEPLLSFAGGCCED